LGREILNGDENNDRMSHYHRKYFKFVKLNLSGKEAGMLMYNVILTLFRHNVRSFVTHTVDANVGLLVSIF